MPAATINYQAKFRKVHLYFTFEPLSYPACPCRPLPRLLVAAKLSWTSDQEWDHSEKMVLTKLTSPSLLCCCSLPFKYFLGHLIRGYGEHCSWLQQELQLQCVMAPLWPLWPDYEGYDRWLQQGSWPGTAATNLATIILRIMEHGAIV